MKRNNQQPDAQVAIADLCYYVYAWKNKDWGDIFFYVGKGHGDRYKSKLSRGQAFTAIVNRWNCYPIILENYLSEEYAIEREAYWKDRLLFDEGYPIVDGEGNHAALKNLACLRKKRYLRANDPNYHDGRKPIEIDMELFHELLAKHQKGEMTVSECCKALGIGRTTWYNRTRAM